MENVSIKSFKIDNLFGYQNVDIKFETKHLVIIGENGLGKTTVLNCLYYTLEKKFKDLNNIKFDKIEISFSNRKKISFTKNDLDFYVKKSRRNQSSQFYQILKKDLDNKNIKDLKEIIVSKKLSIQDKRLNVLSILREVGVRVNAPSGYIYMRTS
jgi:predicted ATP-dependent endonuclease of OLD family